MAWNARVLMPNFLSRSSWARPDGQPRPCENFSGTVPTRLEPAVRHSDRALSIGGSENQKAK